jgi:hypothetical protein
VLLAVLFVPEFGLLAVLIVSVPEPVPVVEESGLLLDELPLLLQDQTNAADKQMAKESNFFFIKWFLCGELQKTYAKPSTTNFSFQNH